MMFIYCPFLPFTIKNAILIIIIILLHTNSEFDISNLISTFFILDINKTFFKVHTQKLP